MSSVQAILLDDAREALLREIAPVAGRNDLHEAFAAWLVPGTFPNLSIEGAIDAALGATGAQRTYQDVAVLGLAAQIRRLQEKETDALHSGLKWVVWRQPVVNGTPMGFCMDSVALLALILGAKAADDPELSAQTGRWVERCREATAGGLGLGVWQEWMVDIVAAHTGFAWRRKAEDSPYASEVRVALQSRGIRKGEKDYDIDTDEQQVLDLVKNETSAGLGAIRAVIRLAALDWIRRVRPVADLRNVQIQDLCNLLRRVPAGLKKWTWEDKPRTRAAHAARKWHIDNEYHVQNILWLLLAPMFPDLVDEDATPKVGPVQPRADIGIPALRLIVEAKFMRSGDGPKDVIEQIAEDASLYLVPGSRYDCMVPFVWDDSCRTEHHDELICGLRQIEGVVDAIIVSRPGSMLDNRAPRHSDEGERADSP